MDDDMFGYNCNFITKAPVDQHLTWLTSVAIEFFGRRTFYLVTGYQASTRDHGEAVVVSCSALLIQ
jgi:hypothetical protein